MDEVRHADNTKQTHLDLPEPHRTILREGEPRERLYTAWQMLTFVDANTERLSQELAVRRSQVENLSHILEVVRDDKRNWIERVDRAEQIAHAWLQANSPGGWIDNLRNCVSQLGNDLRKEQLYGKNQAMRAEAAEAYVRQGGTGALLMRRLDHEAATNARVEGDLRNQIRDMGEENADLRIALREEEEKWDNLIVHLEALLEALSESEGELFEAGGEGSCCACDGEQTLGCAGASVG